MAGSVINESLITRKHLIRGCLHEILIWAKLNFFNSLSGQSLITVYMKYPEMKLIAGIISFRSFWQKWDIILGGKTLYKHCLKWNHMKGNNCTCTYFIKTKIIGFNWTGQFSWTTPEMKFDFISPAMKSNVNRTSFMADWNFISGLM